jgi:hypothetical protein
MYSVAALNKAIKTDARDSAPLAHGFAILCARGAPLCRRLWRRYEVAPIFLMGQICEAALKRQGSSEKFTVCPGYPAQQIFYLGQVA